MIYYNLNSYSVTSEKFKNNNNNEKYKNMEVKHMITALT